MELKTGPGCLPLRSSRAILGHPRHVGLLLVGCGAAAALCQVKNSDGIRMLGLSGAVVGVAILSPLAWPLRMLRHLLACCGPPQRRLKVGLLHGTERELLCAALLLLLADELRAYLALRMGIIHYNWEQQYCVLCLDWLREYSSYVGVWATWAVGRFIRPGLVFFVLVLWAVLRSRCCCASRRCSEAPPQASSSLLASSNLVDAADSGPDYERGECAPISA